jgi:hypothetical protein
MAGQPARIGPPAIATIAPALAWRGCTTSMNLLNSESQPSIEHSL